MFVDPIGQDRTREASLSASLSVLALTSALVLNQLVELQQLTLVCSSFALLFIGLGLLGCWLQLERLDDFTAILTSSCLGFMTIARLTMENSSDASIYLGMHLVLVTLFPLLLSNALPAMHRSTELVCWLLCQGIAGGAAWTVDKSWFLGFLGVALSALWIHQEQKQLTRYLLLNGHARPSSPLVETLSWRTQLANITHDLQTPLSGLISGGESLTNMLMKMKEETVYIALPNDMHKDFEQACNTSHALQHIGQYMVTTVHLFVDYCKLIHGQMLIPRNEDVSVPDLLQQAVDFIRDVQPTSHSIHVQCDSSIQVVSTDKQWMEESVFSLLHNACKYAATGDITLSAYLQDEQLVIQVEDNGPGIESGLQPLLFKPLLHLQRQAGGSGLGLYILSSRSTALGGSCGTTAKQNGAIFWMKIPHRPVRVRKLASRALRVLVADDSGCVLKMVQMLLSKHGHHVDVATNGQEAVDAWKKNKAEAEGAGGEPFDLILMDIQMPVIDGIKAISAIRAAEHSFKVAIVACSASGDGEDLETKAIAAGAEGFLPKPFRMDSLMSVLQKVDNARK